MVKFPWLLHASYSFLILHYPFFISFVKLSRLQGRKVNEYIQKRGNVWKGSTMVIRWLKGHPKHPAANPARSALYVGTAASAKLDKSAVKRNRMRRRCREALRTLVAQEQSLQTAQLLLMPRSSSLRCDFDDIRADITAFLSILRS